MTKPAARGAIRSEAHPHRLTGRARRPSLGKRCTATARNGKPCQAPPLRGKKRCAFHSGNRASVCGQRGGRRRAIFNPDGLEPMKPPQNAAELLLLLSQTIVEVRSAKIDTRAANSIAYLGASFLRAAEVSDLELRLRALEERNERRDTALRRSGAVTGSVM